MMGYESNICLCGQVVQDEASVFVGNCPKRRNFFWDVANAKLDFPNLKRQSWANAFN
jgi:hypothetical protein